MVSPSGSMGLQIITAIDYLSSSFEKKLEEMNGLSIYDFLMGENNIMVSSTKQGGTNCELFFNTSASSRASLVACGKRRSLIGSFRLNLASRPANQSEWKDRLKSQNK